MGALSPFGGGGAGSPSNTMWPGPRPTCTPSFVLIRRTVWTNRAVVTNGRPKTVCPMLSDRCLSVCPVLSVSDVLALWPNGCTDHDETWHAGRARPWPHCVRQGPSSPSPKGACTPSNKLYQKGSIPGYNTDHLTPDHSGGSSYRRTRWPPPPQGLALHPEKTVQLHQPVTLNSLLFGEGFLRK